MFTLVFVFVFSFVCVFLLVFTIVFVFVFSLTSLISHDNYSSCRSRTFRVLHFKADQVLCEHLFTNTLIMVVVVMNKDDRANQRIVSFGK